MTMAHDEVGHANEAAATCVSKATCKVRLYCQGCLLLVAVALGDVASNDETTKGRVGIACVRIMVTMTR